MDEKKKEVEELKNKDANCELTDENVEDVSGGNPLKVMYVSKTWLDSSSDYFRRE